MKAAVRYAHTNIVARDWESLVKFYAKVFGCTPKPPRRDLAGPWLDELTSLHGARIRGMHLVLPGYGRDGPTLEIFQYSRLAIRHVPRVNRPGLGHIAFAVADVKKALARVEKNGGGRVGAVVEAEIRGAGRIAVAYARDPEGNIIELQRWR
jgi:predicted enzyme related to lactoylglutathione lyase